MAGTIRSGARQMAVAELVARAAQAAAGLSGLGVGEADSVALILRNDFPYLEASLACQQLGAFAVPINWHGKTEEVAYIVRDCGAQAVVVHADLLRNLDGAFPPGVRVFGVETPPELRAAYGLSDGAARIPDATEEWDSWLRGHQPWREPPRPQRASMIYTSGTTGRPKGVRRQPSNPETLARGRQATVEVWGFAPDMRVCITGPFYHSAPNTYVLSSVVMGADITVMPRFEPEELLRILERDRITHMHMVPNMFVRLLKLPRAVRERYDTSSLKWVIHAAAPCPADVKQAMIEWWGPVIHEYYGSTEAGLLTHCDSEQWLRHRGTVGPATSFATLRILDDEGMQVPTGQVGTVYAKQSAVADFTYNGQDGKRREIEREGYITSGDMGYLNAEGFLFLCDRKIDMVISGGVNIYPAEIEAALISLAGVQDCAVFGIPDEEFGESLLAVVEPAAGAALTAAMVSEHLRGKLADYKVPRRIEFQAGLPREDSGKIFKRRLRDPYWAAAGRKI